RYTPPQLTTAQRRAVTEPGPLIVSASAGSGKTRVLVERYVRVLLDGGVDVRRVVAMTFTRKAAAEMLERVATRLDRLFAEAKNPDELLQLRSLRERLVSASISTFHSYCSSLLRRFPIEAKVPPVFGELSAADRLQLRRRAIRVIVEQWLSNHRRNELAELIRVFGSYQALERSLERVLSSPSHLISNYSVPSLQDQLHSVIGRQAKQLANFWQELLGRAGGDAAAECADVLASAQQVLRAGFAFGSDSNDALRQALETFHTKDGALRAKWKRIVDEREARTAKQWAETVRLALDADLETEQRAETAATILVELTCAALEVMDAEKTDLAAFEPDDLQRRALALLDNDSVRSRLRWEIEHILVDEFQDTDPIEYDLLQRLVPLHDHTTDAPELFIVGDPKQSIYGFRGADVRVFERARADIVAAAGAGHDIHLQTSFRMTPELVALVNAVMLKAMPERTSGYEVGYEELCTARAIETCPPSALALLVGRDASATATLVARHIAHITSDALEVWDESFPVPERQNGGFRSAQYRDIAILARKGSTLAAYVQALRAAGIPFRVESGRGFYQTQEVLDVLSFLRLVHNRHDDVAVATFLRSPFIGLSDSELVQIATHGRQQASLFERFATLAQSTDAPPRIAAAYSMLEQLLPIATRLPPTMLVRMLLRRTQWYQNVSSSPRAEQIIANVEKLLEAARQFEQQGFRNLLDFVEELDSLRLVADTESEAAVISDDNVVTLMTIHAAKGLEFPIVYLVGADQLTSGRPETLAITEELGVTIASVEGKETLGGKLARQILRQREHAEERRLLYVALTRAKDHLFIAGTVEPPDSDGTTRSLPSESFLGIVSQALGIEWESDYGVRSVPLQGSVRAFPEDHPRQIESTIEIIYDLPEVSTSAGTPQQQPTVPVMTDVVGGTICGEIVSASQLLLFEHSPKDYYRIYRCGLPSQEDQWQRAVARLEREDDVVGTLAGQIIHRALEYIVARAELHAVDAAIERALVDYRSSAHYTLRQRAAQDVRATLTFLERNGLLSSSPCAFIEQPIIMPLGEHFLYGVPDVLIETPTGWEIWDWKTNRRDERSADDWLAYYRTQLEVYALLAASAFPWQEQFTVRIILTRPPVAMVHRTLNRTELDAARARITSLVEGIVRTAAEPCSLR
ncbi:MAG: hypothetical protein D6747_06025, partial [Chlorobiota bacterium]